MKRFDPKNQTSKIYPHFAGVSQPSKKGREAMNVCPFMMTNTNNATEVTRAIPCKMSVFALCFFKSSHTYISTNTRETIEMISFAVPFILSPNLRKRFKHADAKNPLNPIVLSKMIPPSNHYRGR